MFIFIQVAMRSCSNLTDIEWNAD